MAKIVVGFDSSASEELANAAAELARALEAEVLGIFVEAPSARRLAALPFTVMIEHSGRAQALDVERLDALLAAAAERARNELASAALRGRVPVSFKIARGVLLDELASAADERDLVVVDSVRHSARPVRARGPVTLSARDARHVRPLLELGAAIAGPELLVLIVPEAPRGEGERWADETGRSLLVRRLAECSPHALSRAVGQLSGRLLLVDASDFSEHELAELRRELDCPLVFSR